ncbi:MAG: MFS transporter [Planctomycetota bacterium]|nr:MFS transporter [Planctomycetota bacterium]
MEAATPLRSPRRAPQVAADLRAIWIDGLAWSVMVGMGEQSIPAFAVALGLPGAWAGLVATVPMVVGALMQLVSPTMIRRLGSHRRWVVWNAGIQALSFVPLAIAAVVGVFPGWALYSVAAIYWGAGIATNPAWSTWVGTLVPGPVRLRYFARRTVWLHVFQIGALLAAGWILFVGEAWEQPLAAFGVVFAFAFLARALSTACLTRHSEPDPMPGGMQRVGFRDLAARFRHGSDGRLLAYMLAVQFSANVASPFYMPYMLRELEFSYAQAMGLVAAAFLARAISMPFHRRIAGRHGVGALLWIGGLGIAPSVGLWLLTHDFVLLLLAQLFAGFVWSAYELSTFLMFFDSIRSEERTSILTKYHVANAVAIAAGSLLGGAVLAGAGGAAAAFIAVMALSTVLRLATLFLLRRVAPRPRFAT